ncbi:hypothetical protein [Dactylosporangium sp. NPDC051484]
MRVEVFSNLVHVTPHLWEVFSLPGVTLYRYAGPRHTSTALTP